MKKLKNLKEGCAVLALWYISRINENIVLSACEDNGFARDGMTDEEWKGAAKDLGIKTRRMLKSPLLLRDFIHKYNRGKFLVRTHDHMFVVDDGLVIDPRNECAPGLSRKIINAWRVLKCN